MAESLQFLPEPELRVRSTPPIGDSLARLSTIYREAEETARLANLLGRSLHVAIALSVLAAATLILAGAGLEREASWAVFMIVAMGAILTAYRRAIAQPFERPALKSFAQDLNAILLFAGFAWGSGAFLALPAEASAGLVVLFAAGGAAFVAVLLREGSAALLFLAPAGAVASFACLLQPHGSGVMGAMAVAAASLCVAVAVELTSRSALRNRAIAQMAGLPFA